MTTSQIIDMSQLPAPAVVVVPDFESILATLKADMVEAMPVDLRAITSATLELESEPLTKWLERLAFQLMMERSDRNDSAHAVMLAYARDSDLDQLGAFFGVKRLTLQEADPTALPPIPAVMEADDDFRERIQMAPNGYSVAGPRGAYVFHARSASGQVLDASATSGEPGTVIVSVLSRDGNGTAPHELLATVNAAINADDVRPLSDTVIVQSAGIVPYRIEAKLYTLPGPDSLTVLAAARLRAAAYAQSMHRIGRMPTISGIYAALHIDGVVRVALVSPADDVAVSSVQASWCTDIDITNGGAIG